jgi:hypothetical protein
VHAVVSGAFLAAGVFPDFEDDGGNVENSNQLIRHKIFDSEEELPTRIGSNSEHDVRRQQQQHYQRQRSSSSGGRLLDPSDGAAGKSAAEGRKWSTSLSRRANRSYSPAAVGSGGVLAWLNLMADCDVRYKSSRLEADDVYSSTNSNKRCKYKCLNKNSAAAYSCQETEVGDFIGDSDADEPQGAAALLAPGGADLAATTRLGRSDFVDEILEASTRQQQLLPHQQQQQPVATVVSSRRPRHKRRSDHGGSAHKTSGSSHMSRPYIQSEFGAVLVPGAVVEPLHLSHAMRIRHHVFHCYEFLLMCRLDQDPELWARLCERYGHCDECQGCRAQHPPPDQRQKVPYVRHNVPQGKSIFRFFWIFNFIQLVIDGKNNSKTKVEKVFFFIFMSS